ncbi:hypothetical protein BD310DRAFT_914827 [Dichomitus squalens]|uniref:Uncharacterized protein n=1 Tax=Dichomitus squalens TaxID=114155 RepID=A0A4Q9Q5L2_9APHY|nr:hypothetical protein BD310DRAFT_917952 [Dichomitus squalens]TBU64541.1 hypothetical protein BD310DRAFT_914827 [Dichomitus squalens]
MTRDAESSRKVLSPIAIRLTVATPGGQRSVSCRIWFRFGRIVYNYSRSTSL